MHTLRHIRPLLTLNAATNHNDVLLQLVYTDTLLHGTSAANLNELQVAQNTLARVMCHAPRSVSATELHRQLHWLPIHQRTNIHYSRY